MNCADFIKSLHRDESFDDCAGHYSSCPECRIKYKDDFKLELTLRGIADNCREFDLASSVKKTIATKRKSRRELSITKWLVWIVVGAVSLIMSYLAFPLLSNGFKRLTNEPQPIGKSFEWLILVINNIFYHLNSIRLSESDRGLIYLAIVFMAIALLFLASQLKGMLGRLRVIINR
jgi:hypothetical protein